MDGWSQLLNLMYPMWCPVNMFVEMSEARVALDLNRDFSCTAYTLVNHSVVSARLSLLWGLQIAGSLLRSCLRHITMVLSLFWNMGRPTLSIVASSSSSFMHLFIYSCEQSRKPNEQRTSTILLLAYLWSVSCQTALCLLCLWPLYHHALIFWRSRFSVFLQLLISNQTIHKALHEIVVRNKGLD